MTPQCTWWQTNTRYLPFRILPNPFGYTSYATRGGTEDRRVRIALGIVVAQQGKTRIEGVGGVRKEERRGELAADKHVRVATELSLCSQMARIAVLRDALLRGARRRELASCWYQHRRHQNTAAELTATKSDRILQSPFLPQTQISELNLTDFLWQDIGRWMSRPAVVCTALLAGPTLLQLPSKRYFFLFNCIKPSGCLRYHRVYHSKTLHGAHITFQCSVRTLTLHIINKLALYNRSGECSQRGTD